MRKTIYTFIILIVLVIAAFLVSPYFLGGSAQKNFHDQIVAFNKKSPLSAYITITPESYNRHWFSSNAQVKVTFHTPANMGKPESVSYTYNAVIKHGPIYTVANNGKTKVHWGAGAILLKGDSKDFDGIIIMSTKAGKDFNLFADIPNLVLSDGVGNTYTFHNLSFTTDEGANNNIKYSLSIPAINVDVKEGNPNASVTLNNLKLITNGHDNDSLWLGNANFSIDKIAVGLKEGDMAVPVSTVNNITTNVETNLTSDKTKVNTSLNLNLESLSVMGKTIKPITFSYSVEGIDANAYRQLKAVGDQIQAQLHNGQPTAQQGMEAVGAIVKLIENGLTFKINKVYVGLPKELASSPLSGQAQLTIKPVNDLMQKLMGAIGSAAASQSKSGQQAMDNSRDQALSGLTGVKPQAHSDRADAQQQMEQQLMHSMPAIGVALVQALSAGGKMSVPQSLVKQLLLERYTKMLIHLAARGENITQTPQDLATQAYNYLTTNKMLIPNEDGSMKVQFSFNEGKLLVNGENPAFDLPKPTTATSTPAPAASTPAPAMHHGG
jgi:uncharacterized protein YdgA (DUF945 family)